MYICRLFHRDRPLEQVDARLIADVPVSLGRDPGADWPVDDPASTLSRRHCVLVAEGGRLSLYDKSTNGVFLPSGERAPRDAAAVLAEGDSVRLGGFLLVVEAASDAPIDAGATTVLTPGWRGATPVAVDWSDAEAVPAPGHRDASLIEAFCEGARLDASTLSSEDPVELMRRVGAVYQQTVLGLAALMADRAKVKRDHHLGHTTISASDNNPFKWAPSRKLAEDLLCGRESAFLSNASAVRACFEDLSRHLAGMVAGAEAAVDCATTTLDPTRIEAEARTQGSLLRSRSAVAWDVLTVHHARLVGPDGRAGGDLQSAFSEAYARGSAAEAGPPGGPSER